MAIQTVTLPVTATPISSSTFGIPVKNTLDELCKYSAAGDILYATSGTTLTNLAIGSPGELLGVNDAGTGLEYKYGQLKYAVVKRSSVQTLSNAAFQSVLWNSEIADASSWHSTSTNTNRITPGVAGIYLAKINIITDTWGGTKNILQAEIRVNNSTLIGATYCYMEDNYPMLISLTSYPVVLTNTDYINVVARVTGGNADMTTDSWFSVERRS